MDRPLILLSNDDGYDAAGLIALRAAISAFADVIVCAPRRNMSATSHALTLSSVLRLLAVDETTFAVDGTPADCVYVALHSGTRVVPRRPDLVVSGMNHGPNLGVDVIYSGTVAAAREGAQRGIPAIAISADARAHIGEAAALASRVVERAARDLAGSAVRPAPLLNLNIPPGERWQVRATRLGERLYDDEVIYRLDPRGREYLWIGGSNVRHSQGPDTDTAAWDAGEASLTSLTLELSEPLHAALARRVANQLDTP
jgi:5'-nucleotidase